MSKTERTPQGGYGRALPFVAVVGLLSCGCASARAAPAPAATAAPKTPQVRRTLVARQNVEGAPGWETQLWSIEYPPGAAAPTHRHPVVGIGLVIEGEYESAFDDEPVTRGRAGESFLERPKAEHRMFRNPSKDKPLRFVVTYTIPIGKAPVEF
jgi:quercetin dioxygenase-like cupin family protein